MTQQPSDDLHLRDGRVLAAMDATVLDNGPVRWWFHQPDGLAAFQSLAGADSTFLQVRYPHRRPSWKELGMVCECVLESTTRVRLHEAGDRWLIVLEDPSGSSVASLVATLVGD